MIAAVYARTPTEQVGVADDEKSVARQWSTRGRAPRWWPQRDVTELTQFKSVISLRADRAPTIRESEPRADRCATRRLDSRPHPYVDGARRTFRCAGSLPFSVEVCL